MEKISTIGTVATGVARPKPTATVGETDQLLIECSDLINPKFRLWYCKRFAILGQVNVLKYAAQARADGKDSAKLFSFLIKG